MPRALVDTNYHGNARAPYALSVATRLNRPPTRFQQKARRWSHRIVPSLKTGLKRSERITLALVDTLS